MYIEIVLLFSLFIIYVIGKRVNGKDKNYAPSGPWGIPGFGYLPFLGKVPYLTVSKLSKKYGKIFSLQLGQYKVNFVNDFTTIKEFYKNDLLTGRLQLDLFEKRGKYGLGLLDGKEWIEIRRFLMKCLRDFGFGKRSMESSVIEEVIQARNFLLKNDGKTIYLKPFVELSVLNALWGMMANEKYDIEDPKKKLVAEIMSEGISDQNIVGVASFVPWLAKFFPELSGYAKGLKYFDAPNDLARDILDKHIKNYKAGDEMDFIDHALTKIYSTTDEKSMFYKDVGMKNLFYTIIDIFFAGSDTMSSTLTWTFLYLAYWPDIQAKIHEEIDRVVGTSRLPTLADRSQMDYTEATMCEVLRKSSMVPLGLFHTALDDVEWDGLFFPKGSIFLANLYHVHNEPEYWGDPEVFRPERFLNENGSFRKDEHLIPFFTGRRMCPGESLALLQYFLFFAGIMQNFSFSLDPNTPLPDLSPRAGFILPPPKHLLVVHKRFPDLV